MMMTIYLKSPDERIVVSVRGKNPKMDDWHKRKGYVQIESKEFRRIKARILRLFGMPR